MMGHKIVLLKNYYTTDPQMYSASNWHLQRWVPVVHAIWMSDMVRWTLDTLGRLAQLLLGELFVALVADTIIWMEILS